MIINITDKKYVDIKILNAITLEVKTNIECPIIKNNKNEIDSILFVDYKIKVGEKIKVSFSNRDYEYEINEIIKTKKNNVFHIKTNNRNKSSLFLMPLISNEYETAGNYFYNSYLENCYLYSNNTKEFNDKKHLFLNYRFFDTESFQILEKFLLSNKNYIKTYEFSKNYTTFVYEIPKIFYDDINYFLSGKYSNLSSKAKKKIIYFNKIKTTSNFFKALYNDKELRKKISRSLRYDIPEDICLIDIPDILKETLDIS